MARLEYRFRGGPVINYAKCNSCKKCYEVCPPDVFGLDAKTRLVSVVYPDECWSCGACVLDCKKKAITLEMPIACCG